MIRKALAVTLILAASATFAQAQWVSKERRSAARNLPFHYEYPSASKAKPRAADPSLVSEGLVGTWRLVVDNPDAGGFFALQTFHGDGTLTETSSLLATLVEGPAQGVWSGKQGVYNTTFVLFGFDEAGKVANMIRVRTATRLKSEDELIAQYVVDLVELDGKVTPAIATGEFTGTRVKLELP